MNENRTRTLSVKVTPETMALLEKLMENTRKETNIKISKADMVEKLIRDAAESAD